MEILFFMGCAFFAKSVDYGVNGEREKSLHVLMMGMFAMLLYISLKR